MFPSTTVSGVSRSGWFGGCSFRLFSMRPSLEKFGIDVNLDLGNNPRGGIFLAGMGRHHEGLGPRMIALGRGGILSGRQSLGFGGRDFSR